MWWIASIEKTAPNSRMYPTLKLIVEYLGTYVSIFFFLGRGCLFFLKFSKVSLRMRQTHDENNSHTQRMVVFLRSQVFWLEVKIESSFLNSVLCLLKRLQVPGYMGVKSHNRIIHTSTPKKKVLRNIPAGLYTFLYWTSQQTSPVSLIGSLSGSALDPCTATLLSSFALDYDAQTGCSCARALSKWSKWLRASIQCCIYLCGRKGG